MHVADAGIPSYFVVQLEERRSHRYQDEYQGECNPSTNPVLVTAQMRLEGTDFRDLLDHLRHRRSNYEKHSEYCPNLAAG